MPRLEVIRLSDSQPTWLQRTLGAVRSYWSGPLTSRSPELAQLMGSGPTSSGVTVNPEKALGLSAVWSAVSMISDDIASIPLDFYKRDGKSKTRFDNHPLFWLLKSAPNPEMTSMVFRRTMQVHLLLWGNAYAEIERDKVGRPIALWPLLPENVSFERAQGRIRYRVGGDVFIDSRDMLHLVGMSHDGSTGANLVTMARESLGAALATEQFGATFFANGGTLSGVISNKGAKPTQASDKNKSEAEAQRHQGVQRAHKWLQLWNDASFTPISVTPDAAQFLETRTFQIREVARWFKIPAHKLADLADATFSNVEQMETAYYTSCLRPWIVLWEQTLNRSLIFPLEQGIQYFEFNIEGFLRADATSRAALHTAEFNVGGITSNEIRSQENRNPIDGGDQAFVQMNLIPVSLATRYAEAQIKKLEADAAPKTVPAPPTEDQINSFLQVVERQFAEQNAMIRAEAQQEREQRMALQSVADDAQRQVETLTQDVEAARAALTEKEAALSALDAAHRAALDAQAGHTAEQVAFIEQRWQAERAALVTSCDDLQRAKNDLDVMLGVAEQERQAAQSAVEAATAREAEARAALVAAEAELAKSGDAIRAAEAVAAELRQQVAEQREAAERLASAAAQAEAARATAEALIEAERQAATVALAERAEIRGTALAAEDRLRTVAAAHRSLIVDATARLLQREADRARKAQATPEKLRAWVESFYPLHAETCRSVLRPVVLAWAASCGANAERALVEAVSAHVETSRRDLRLAAETDDADELAANLARVLQRWETERADAVADRLMAEGERYGH